MARQSSLNCSLLDGERTPGIHVATRIFICRHELYFASDIHLGGLTLSEMLHKSPYVQCYSYKAQKTKINKR